MIQVNFSPIVNTGAGPITIKGPVISSPSPQGGHGGPDKKSGHSLLLSLLVVIVISIVVGVVVVVKVYNMVDTRAVAIAAPTTTFIVQSSAPATPPAPTSTASTALPKAEALQRPQPKQGVSESLRSHSDRCDCGPSGLKKNDNANADTDSLGTKNSAVP